MPEEVVIVQGNPESVYEGIADNKIDLKKTNLRELEFTEFVKGRYNARQTVKQSPQYAAIYVNGEQYIGAIMEIDRIEDKIIIAKGKPVPVYIPIRLGKKPFQGIRYTTFRKLITHKTTDDL